MEEGLGLGAPTEAALVAGARGGDELAFGALVDRYGRRVVAYCRRMVRQETVAEDLAQEVFTKLYFALESVDPQRPLAPFLFRIAHNHCLDWLRVRRPVMEPLSDTDGDRYISHDPADSAPGPEERLLQGDELAVVERALAVLPAHYRSVLLLRHVEELSYGEIAEALRVPIGTVKVRLHRGRERLKQELADRVNL